MSPGATGMSSGVYTDPAIPNVNARAWGNFVFNGKGNGNLLDTWVAVETVSSVDFTVQTDRALDADGDLEVAHLSNITKDEAIEIGTVIGALIGLGIEGEEGMEIGAEIGAEAGADGVNVFTDEDAWDIIEEIPNDSAAALLLVEHHWAVPLRDAVFRAGGHRISDGFISPEDLVAIGLVASEEAAELAELESAL